MVDDDDDDDEIHPRLSNGGQSHFDMDEAFCARMRKAIEAGLEKAPRVQPIKATHNRIRRPMNIAKLSEMLQKIAKISGEHVAQ